MSATVESFTTRWNRQARLAAGRHAAMTRKGIEWRSPQQLAHQHYDQLIRTADPAALRLLAIEVAGEVLPLFQAAPPDNHVPAVALQVARRYAAGTATDAERIAAKALLIPLCCELEADSTQQAAYAAASAVFFCLWKNPRDALEWVSDWAARARGSDPRNLWACPQAIAALEALPRA